MTFFSPKFSRADAPVPVDLWRSLIRDRWLGGLTLALSLAVLLPLLLTPFLPLTDLPNHVALASQIGYLLRGDPLTSHHYMLQPHPSPYWLLYLLILVPSYVLKPMIAVKLVVGAALLIAPLGLMRLLAAMGRSPWLGLWAFALSWEFSLTVGFVAYSLASGLTMFFAARALESFAASGRRIAATVVLGVGLAATHAHGAGMCSVLVFALALAELPHLRRSLVLIAWSSVPTLGLLPWILFGATSDKQPMPAHIANFPQLGVRISRLFLFTVDLVATPWAQQLLCLILLVLLLGPLLLLHFRAQGTSALATRRAYALYGAAWLLYLAMPSELFWPFPQLLIYERHATLILSMGLTLPALSLVGRQRWLLAPGIVAGFVSAACIAFQCHEFAKQSAPMLEIIDAIKPGSRINSILWEHRTPESVRDTLSEMPAYIIAEKGGYYPDLFQTPNLPVRYIEKAHLPQHGWSRPQNFNATAEAPFYDYILVQGSSKDRVRAGSVGKGDARRIIRKKLDAGVWRLYSIEKSPVEPAR